MGRRVMEQMRRSGMKVSASRDMRVGRLVTAVEDFTGWEAPNTWLSFSKLSLNRG
jgi:hypothetical protein